jgi:acyl-[acyl carrier protein]--UDP-N-acetylglucosamine O-acyltransferase
MSKVHPSAILTGDVQISKGAEVGPFCAVSYTHLTLPTID